MEFSLRFILYYFCLLPLHTVSFSSPIDPTRPPEAKMTPPLESRVSSSTPVASTSTPSSPTDVRGDMEDHLVESSSSDKNLTDNSIKKTLPTSNPNRIHLPLAECRDLTLQLTVLVGHLCQHVLTALPWDQPSVGWASDATLRRTGALILQNLLRLARATRLDLETCIHKKMALNRQKYPVELCKVSWSMATTASGWTTGIL